VDTTQPERDAIWRVVTFNIWNRQGPWAQRLPLIRDGLRALDADVIGLQEVLGFPGMPSQAHEIASGTDWNVHYAPAWHLGGGLQFGNAILSRYPLRDPQILPLPTPDTGETRTVAFARVELPHGPMPVFVTHLTFQAHLGHVRCAQVRALADHAAELAPVDGPPAVLLGDFNGNPDSDEMRFLRGLTPLGGTSVYFNDCWDATHDPTELGYTYARDNAFALRSREPSRRIDYAYVRGPGKHLRGEPIACRVALTAAADGVWASDHYAVVADIYAAPRAHDHGV
jgi:endonuclease/exonuclease/phosphatase family metal-dependent hydrolase